MKNKNCIFAEDCKKDCPPYVKQCKGFIRAVIAYAVKTSKMSFTPEVEKLLATKVQQLKKLSLSMDTVSKEESLAHLIALLLQYPSLPKFYTYHSAVQAGLEEELPTEGIIFINSYSKYTDSQKQYQVIASFISKLQDSGKSVIHLHKADYQC